MERKSLPHYPFTKINEKAGCVSIYIQITNEAMKPKISAQSGTFESSDVIILIEPLPDNSGRNIELSSTVFHQYGESFNKIVVEMLDEFDMTDIHLIAKDKGALEPTIKARLETAIRRSMGEQESTINSSK
jgi:citrate lyase subunit gamma (acyl carrier protein)